MKLNGKWEVPDELLDQAEGMGLNPMMVGPTFIAGLAATAAHNANKVLCEAMGDFSQVDFNDAPEWQRESSLNGVLKVWEDPTMTPERIHEEWVKDKLAAGWVYGEVKNAEKKTHPCLVPYNQLPETQRRKDDLFLAIAKAFDPFED